MITTAEMTGIRTSERIEFNPQQDLLGKVISRPWLPLNNHKHGKGLNNKGFMRTI
jgi:hypothetical protein